MMFLALATPTSGLAWSSNGTSSTFQPAFSRLPLNFSTASCVPKLDALTECGLAARERALGCDLDRAFALGVHWEAAGTKPRRAPGREPGRRG